MPAAKICRRMRKRAGKESQVLGKESDGVGEGGGAAVGALHPVVHERAIAAGFTQGVPANDEQSWDVVLFVELLVAGSADHLTDRL